ncbi:MAG: golvesin C-terminal-like domain-containing protein [Armatimonadota bacterium]
MKRKSLAYIISAVMIIAVACATAFAADDWTMFRRDKLRTGATDPAIVGGVLQPTRPHPIWVYPAPVPIIAPIDNDFGATDVPAFVADPAGVGVNQWKESNANLANRAPNAHNDNYLYIETQYSQNEMWENWFTGATPRPSAKWTLDRTASTVSANFYAYVWFPSTASEESPKIHTRDAHYTVQLVYDNAGVTVTEVLGHFVLDQSSGEAWLNIGTDPFEVKPGQKLEVLLTNESQDESGTPSRIVIADAVKFEQDTGSVVSSPVTAQTADPDPILVTSPILTRRLETVTNQDGSRDLGVVNGLHTEDLIATPTDDRGTLAWRFPENSHNWISDGITSTPAITSVAGEEVAIVPSGDGQVYAVKTKPTLAVGESRLLWQGPGYILNDPTTKTAAWTEVNLEPGYQGASFWRTGATLGGTDEAQWQTAITARGSYSIYVWIPPSTVQFPLFSSVHYEVTIPGLPATMTVNVNQRNGGQWIKLGTYSVQAGSTVSIKLINDRGPSAGNPLQYVAVDAVKIVPADLGAFEMSSPVIDSAGNIYVGSTNGRIYKFAVGSADPVWTYPNPNTTPGITDVTNVNYPAPNSIGGIFASPTLSEDEATIYVGSEDGHVYAINTADGSRKWRYPGVTGVEVNQNLGEISSTSVVGSHIYVAIGGESDNIPHDASGRVVALTDAGNQATPAWWYPSDPFAATGEVNVGEFLYSSPLLIERPGDTDPSLYVGSTDGMFYGINTVDGTQVDNIHPAEAGLQWIPSDLRDMVMSSPAGTSVSGGYTTIDGTTWPGQSIPLAFVGSDNQRLYSVDLRNGNKDWWWNLLGYVSSSPAIMNNRIYVGDEGGFVWAFSTRPEAGGGAGGEGWNSDGTGITEPPTGGSDTGDTENGKIEIDVYSKAVYDTWVANVASSTNPHTLATALPKTFEWGENIYFVIWGIKDPTSKLEVSLKSRAGGRQAATGSEPITVPQSAIQQTSINGEPVYYAKYYYSLDGSNAQKTQTPGASVSVSVTETASVNGKDQKIGENVVPDLTTGTAGNRDKFVARLFSVNNPLGIVYTDTYEGSQIAVTGAFSTDRDIAMAAVNGNLFNPVTRAPYPTPPPFVRAPLGTAHGTTSSLRELIVCDRSLMGAYGRQLSKFRVDFSDFNWFGGVFGGTLLPWEVPPVFGPWNSSPDYPNILEQQGVAKMESSNLDPSRISAGLAGTTNIAGGNPPVTWNVGRNGVLFGISVPRFQPANVPFAWNNRDSLRWSGYSGRVRLYIDSNNDGRFNSAWNLGSANLRRRGRAGRTNRTEAYRDIFVQAHVLPDRHIEIVEKTIDIGQVPHGFALTRDAAGNPVPFYDDLASNLATWDPAGGTWGFKDWFKPFTVYNQGNVNITNLRIHQPSLVSDTVSELYALSGSTGAAAAGARIPNAHTFSSIDPLFIDDGPGYGPLRGWTSRTFHKARVGEDATTLNIPDCPPGIYSDQFFQTYTQSPTADQKQQLPKVSISIPVGQPAGTYYGKFTLYNDDNNNGAYERNETLGDPVVNLAITVAEDRLTDGGMDGSLPHLDDGSIANTGDIAPAAFRDPTSGNVHMFWSSSRYGMENTGRAVATPNTMDPWYLYVSTLPWDVNNSRWNFSTSNPLPNTSWWLKTGPDGTANVSNPFPAASYLDSGAANSFFPGPTAIIPNLGVAGDTKLDTVKFYSPSVAVDKISKRVWAFFLGQAYKTGMQSMETRSYVTEITGANLSADNVYDTNRRTPGSTRNIDGDWSTPKYGFKGLATHMQRVDTDPAKNLFLWTFWFGGNNGKWRIFYNANIDPDGNNGTTGKDNWVNDTQLPIPNGLASMAEPSPIYKENIYWDPDNSKPYKDLLDVVYSGYSSFHKNSDIYLSRYQPNTVPDKKKGSILMQGNQPWRLPLRGAELFLNTGSKQWNAQAGTNADLVPFVKLTRDSARGVWTAKDVDWDPNLGFRVMVFTNTSTGNLSNWTWYEITTPNAVRDPRTGSYMYNYENDPALRELFRSAVVDPAAGTVKFLRSPGKYAMVVATYTPRAYRITTDSASDDSPFAILDTDGNPRYKPGDPDGNNPFHMINGWDAARRPSTDRLWVFWRRPGISKPGIGIHYKTYRYAIQLKDQIAVDAATGKPQVTSVTPLNISEGGWPLSAPVEIDWSKNRLYFNSAEEGNRVQLSYINKNGQTVNLLGTVELTEELGPSKEGSVFGNLTQLMINEGQVSAFKDRVEDSNGNILEDRIWSFWVSTRSGNSDIFYETISPRFYGVNF